VPPIVLALAKHPVVDNFDLSKLRVIVSGAAPLGSELEGGDTGFADDDGYFWIVDRVKELIKYKGLQVAPAELEALLISHPAVADAAVIGIPDEEAGELPKAFVVRKGDVTEEEIMAFVAEQVAPYKRIGFVQFIDQVPKSPTGKILRRVLKQGTV
jgi:acyl-coenzyme A synthetase/AMP-(fatty) acid ligase